MIEKLSNNSFDLVIIGGGITGAGVALQAAASGLSVALLEMQDFAEGTSSRSTKLVHGGIRYLKTFDVEVVSDTVSERAIIQGIAPHIPKADPMILPIYDEPGSTFNMFSVKVAMDLYDHLANVTGKYANYMLSKEEILEREPQLAAQGLLGGGVYLDYRNNDARLVIENIKQAVEDGAMAVSRIKVEEILHDDQGNVSGVRAKDLLSEESFSIDSQLVINTAGPWSDIVKKLDKKIDHKPHMRPTKGVHLVVNGEKLKVPQPTYFDTGEQDGRMIFVIPRESKTYFGTTDTDYQGDFDHPKVEQADVDYLLKVVNHRYPEVDLTIDDIEASWAGLRPLISDASGDYNGTKKEKISDENFEKIIR
ncbi:MAG: FAD-dependent oxidoreductase, partial [Enterococcus viikkiensis]